MRRLTLRLLGVLLSFALGLGLVEVVLRLLPPGGDGYSSTLVPARMRSPRARPDFRERGLPGPREAGTFRVVALGDSFTWGAGVHSDDAYPDRLQRRLATLRSEQRFEVVNWSRPGWNTVEAADSLTPALDELDPQLLLLGFVLNDAEPVARSAREELRRPLERRRPSSALGERLYRNSRLFALLWERLENTRQHRAFREHYHRLFEDGPDWQACRAALAELQRLSVERDIPFVLVVFPVFDSQLGPAYRYRELHGRVVSAAEELGVETLDLLPYYDGIDARRLSAEPFTDSHPSELGHRIAADRILERFFERGWIPAERPGRRPRGVPVAVPRRDG